MERRVRDISARRFIIFFSSVNKLEKSSRKHTTPNPIITFSNRPQSPAMMHKNTLSIPIYRFSHRIGNLIHTL